MQSIVRPLGLIIRYLSPLVVILLGIVVAKALIDGRKAPATTERAARVLPVETLAVHLEQQVATLRVYGTVEPLRSLSVRPMVGGPIVELHPELIVGGRIHRGEPMVQIDPRDYELTLEVAKAAVVAARAELDIERGNAAVAALEWSLLEDSVETSDESKRLALREPFLEQRTADVQTAESQVSQAKLSLDRTQITAPFDGLVISESVEVGMIVNLGSEIATLVNSETFGIEVSVPQDRLTNIDWANGIAQVRVGSGAAREARIERLMGEVDREGRMARIQIAIDDPLDYSSQSHPAGSPASAVLLGSYAEVELPLLPFPSAMPLPRQGLREGDTVWIVDGQDQLAVRSVEVGLRREEDVLIIGGLAEGDRVITSPIAVPIPGMAVRPLDIDATVEDEGEGGESL